MGQCVLCFALGYEDKYELNIICFGASLMVLLLRVHLAMQGTHFNFWSGKVPHA